MYTPIPIYTYHVQYVATENVTTRKRVMTETSLPEKDALRNAASSATSCATEQCVQPNVWKRCVLGQRRVWRWQSGRQRRVQPNLRKRAWMGHQGSSVNRRYQLSFVGRLWYRRSPLPQGNRLLLNVSVRYLGRLGRGKFVLDGLGWKDKNQRTYYSYTTTTWWLSTLRCN